MNTCKTLIRRLFAAALLVIAPAALAEHHEELPDYAERAMAIEVDATVVSVDMDTRVLVLELPTGEQLSTVVDPAVERLGEVEAGDLLVVEYIAAVAFELREPTEEELANPWVEGVDAGISEADAPPQGALLSAVRAVCTIEGMNRLLGTVMILDSRGQTHVVGDVTAERIESLSIGEPVVVTFAQALAVGIEKPAM